MTRLVPQTGDIPRPQPTALSRPYWDGCRRNELLFQRCKDCDGVTPVPAVLCSSCSSQNLVWEQSSGRGKVYSWTTIWRPATPAFTVPYVAVIVEMEEGWQMLANLVGCEHDDVDVDLPVEVTFHALDAELTLPYFRPA